MLSARCDRTGLHPELERWGRDQGWESLRPFQKEASDLILGTNRDLIISASTAAGKTEAAYLPLLTQAANRGPGVSVLCLSPTKALINDQVRRIIAPATRVGVPVFAWHGDASQARKSKLLREGRGIVVMTVESLEGRFIRHPRMVVDLFSDLDAILIDEFHEFHGGARGAQLACLLARLDDRTPRPARRIALSATISDITLAQQWIRPQDPRSVKLVKGPDELRDLVSRVRGYTAHELDSAGTLRAALSSRPPVAIREIEGSIFQRLKAGTHIVFAGSRSNVEDLCDGLVRRCERTQVQNTFVPHHGSMAKHGREDVEERLRSGEQLTVLTTTTLALGVDIGSVDSVELIGPPLSLTTFRQMVGRSGRRHAPAAVSLHITERPFASVIKLGDRLRLSTVRAYAALNLLGTRYFEPPVDDGTTLSVVVQQVLSIIKQRNGANLPQLLNLTQSVAAFDFLTERMLREMLEHLALPEEGWTEQTRDGRYILTEKAERLVHSSEFYAAFQTTDQWDVVAHGIGKVGQMSLSNPLATGDTFRLSGGAWEVKHLDPRHYRVIVVPATAGAVPIFDPSPVSGVDEQVAREMRLVLEASDVPQDLDRVAAQHLEEGRATYRGLRLDSDCLVADGDVCQLLSWRGTRFNRLLVAVLRYKGYLCSANEVAVTIASSDTGKVASALSGELPSLEELSKSVGSVSAGKHDRKIPPGVLRQYWTRRHASLEQPLREFCASLNAA